MMIAPIMMMIFCSNDEHFLRGETMIWELDIELGWLQLMVPICIWKITVALVSALWDTLLHDHISSQILLKC